MAVSYSWKDVSVLAYPEQYNQVDVIYSVEGTCVCTSDNGGTSEKVLKAGIAWSDPDSYTALADVTKDQVVGWLENAINPDILSTFKAHLETDANQTIVKKFED